MRDDEIAEMGQHQHLQSPKEPKQPTWKSLLFFVIAMAAIYFIGAILTPILPDELIVMLVYAILYFFFGFDPTKWIKGK